MSRWRSCILVLAALAAASASAARAQSGGSYAIVAHVIGAAAQVSGDVYSTPASMASPEAGAAAGGAYVLDTGFWLGVEVLVVGIPTDLPTRLSFSAPAPNPSAGATHVSFALPAEGPVRLDVFALDGRRVDTLLDGVLPRGHHEATWSGTDFAGARVASGVYFLVLRAAGQRLTQRVVRLRP